MSRHVVRCLVGVVLTAGLAGCGVTPQPKPEPLPATAPPITLPTVTQQVTPDPPRSEMYPGAVVPAR